MSYAKHITAAPGFDAGAAVRNSEGLSSAWGKFAEWKRWVEATSTQDGKGLADVVEANARGLDGLKGHVDGNTATIRDLEARVQRLEDAPAARPFP